MSQVIGRSAQPHRSRTQNGTVKGLERADARSLLDADGVGLELAVVDLAHLGPGHGGYELVLPGLGELGDVLPDVLLDPAQGLLLRGGVLLQDYVRLDPGASELVGDADDADVLLSAAELAERKQQRHSE